MFIWHFGLGDWRRVLWGVRDGVESLRCFMADLHGKFQDHYEKVL